MEIKVIFNPTEVDSVCEMFRERAEKYINEYCSVEFSYDDLIRQVKNSELILLGVYEEELKILFFINVIEYPSVKTSALFTFMVGKDYLKTMKKATPIIIDRLKQLGIDFIEYNAIGSRARLSKFLNATKCYYNYKLDIRG